MSGVVSADEPSGSMFRSGFALFFLGYAIFLLASLPSYGPTWDVFGEFPRATAYVDQLFGGETPSGISPWHHLSYEAAQSELAYSANPVLPSLIAALSGKIFFETFGLLGYIDAYHLGLVTLWLLFLIHFHLRMTELHGERLALLATILLALAPRVLAHVPNNPKDLPALAFGTAGLLEIAVAVTRDRPRRIYFAAFFIGCAISSKFTAGIIAIPGIVLIYLALREGPFIPWRRLPFLLPLASIPIVTALILFAHWPYLWESPATIRDRLHTVLSLAGTRTGTGPSFYPFIMCFITTPVVTLAGLAAAAGAWIKKPSEDRSERVLLAFHVVWLLSVLAIFASGIVALFDGVRHFLLAVPPLIVLSAWGILRVVDAVVPMLAERGVGPRVSGATLAGVLLLAAIVPVALYHPYETAYYNVFAGGLRGARQIDFGENVLDFEAGDYWGTSIRGAVDWANANLPENSALWISLPPRFAEKRLYPLRSDLVYASLAERRPGRAHYLLFLNREGWFWKTERQVMRSGERVHQEEVRGVPLAFVYRLPPPPARSIAP